MHLCDVEIKTEQAQNGRAFIADWRIVIKDNLSHGFNSNKENDRPHEGRPKSFDKKRKQKSVITNLM